VLAKGLQFNTETSPWDELRITRGVSATPTKVELEPWEKKTNEVLQGIETNAREGAKGLMPDPRTTGTAANLVNGFSRSITEFGMGALGGPATGAAVLGTTEGYARYHDLKDQGVDDETAQRSALITGVTNAAGALIPFNLPAKLLEPLSTAGTFLTQMGAGATINASLGAASREADSLILSHAGYPEMAEQSKPWDEANLMADAITGAFFGGAAAHEGFRNSTVAPSVRDAASVIHDHQEILNRAPGVPVDMASAAIHRDALEHAMTDLLSNRPVDLSDMEGATFARPEQDTALSRQIMREEFEKAGVLADAEEFDRWLKGEEPKPKELPPEKAAEPGEVLTPESVQARLKDAQERLEAAGPELKPEERAAAVEAEKERLMKPESVRQRLEEKYGEEMPKVVQERAEATVAAPEEARKQAQGDLEKARADQEQLARTADPAIAALAEHPDMELAKDVKASDALEVARMEHEQAEREADTAFSTAVTCEARHAG